MNITNAAFLSSNTSIDKLPADNLPEYAFIGRSNVGKSSLINALVRRKGLAKTSSVPGKTITINHFVVDDQWYIVDLPGYGYAQRSKKARDGWRTMLGNYLTRRRNLITTFVLVDARIQPQNIDIEFIKWLGENQVPFAIVFTKMDKISEKELNENIAAYKERLMEDWEELPLIFITSSVKGIGREDIIDYIEQQNKAFEEYKNGCGW